MSRRISALLTQDVQGRDAIVYRGEVYRKVAVRTRMADAGKHCVSVFNELIREDQVISAAPGAVTTAMLSSGTPMSDRTAENYLADIQRMCNGQKPWSIPEARIRAYAWEMNAFALLKAFDEVA